MSSSNSSTNHARQIPNSLDMTIARRRNNGSYGGGKRASNTISSGIDYEGAVYYPDPEEDKKNADNHSSTAPTMTTASGNNNTNSIDIIPKQKKVSYSGSGKKSNSSTSLSSFNNVTESNQGTEEQDTTMGGTERKTSNQPALLQIETQSSSNSDEEIGVVVDDFSPNDDNNNGDSTKGKRSDETTASVTNTDLNSSTTTNLVKALADAKSSYSLYSNYELEIDPKQDNKAIELVLCNFSRPHMRSFHFAWMCFFVAYFIWFDLAPLMGEIRSSLGITYEDIWTSHIASYTGTLLLRLINGPLCDYYGARLCMGFTLILVSIPTACTGLIQTSVGLSALRFFTGFAGTAFVSCQYWTSQMFVKEVSGTANALAAGWGNVGGGIAPLVMGGVLFPLFKTMGLTSEQAWRTICLIPATVAIIVGYLCLKYSDDSPRGYYKQLKQHGVMPSKISPTNNLWVAFKDVNMWMLFIQYAMCLGVELTMNNAAVLYFIDVHEMTTEQAGGVASLFGLMNLFARAIGGYLSDWANLRMGMRGRLILQTCCLVGEGALVWAFSHKHNLGATIINLIIFSLFVQATEGSTYGIIPYVNPRVTGAITGFVSAGGNIGAILFAVVFRQLHGDYHHAFMIMAILIWISAFCSLGIHIPGLAGLCWGKDSPEAIAERQAYFQQQDEPQSHMSSSPGPIAVEQEMRDESTIDGSMRTAKTGPPAPSTKDIEIPAASA